MTEKIAPAPLAARWIATWFGSGASPWAPGTVGAIAALPLYVALRSLGPIPYAAVTLGVTLSGVWAANRVAEATGDEDPSSVVVDEVAGTLIALGLARRAGLGAEIAALVLFRVLDIAKPGPIDRVQRLRPPGLGIMADDVLAGLAAGVLARAGAALLQR